MALYHCMWFACVSGLQGIQGTGAGGRIVSRDVAAAQATAPAGAPSTAGPYQTIELSNMRKVSNLVPSHL